MAKEQPRHTPEGEGGHNSRAHTALADWCERHFPEGIVLTGVRIEFPAEDFPPPTLPTEE